MPGNAEKCFGLFRNCPVFGQISVYLLYNSTFYFPMFFFSYGMSTYRFEYYLINMLLLLAKFSMQKCKYVENKT